jgi:hypothetical protein
MWKHDFGGDHLFKFDKAGFKQLIIMNGKFYIHSINPKLQSVSVYKWKVFGNRYNIKDKFLTLDEDTLRKVYNVKWSFEYNMMEQLNILKLNKAYIEECKKLENWYPKFTKECQESSLLDRQESAPLDPKLLIYHPRASKKPDIIAGRVSKNFQIVSRKAQISSRMP